MRGEEKRREECLKIKKILQTNCPILIRKNRRTKYLFESSESYPHFQLIISFELEFSAVDNSFRFSFVPQGGGRAESAICRSGPLGIRCAS